MSTYHPLNFERVHKSSINYEIDCSNCQAVYFGESKRLLKSRSDEHRMELLTTAGKQIAQF